MPTLETIPNEVCLKYKKITIILQFLFNIHWSQTNNLFVFLYFPPQLFIQITKNLSTKDLKSCRLVSSLIREKVDRLFTCHLWVVHLNEKSEREFIAKRKPALEIPIFFTRMKITGNVSYFLPNKNNPTKMLTLCKEYFQNVTELEINEFVPKNYFHQIIELTRNLQILKLSSAVLGGEIAKKRK